MTGQATVTRRGIDSFLDPSSEWGVHWAAAPRKAWVKAALLKLVCEEDVCVLLYEARSRGGTTTRIVEFLKVDDGRIAEIDFLTDDGSYRRFMRALIGRDPRD